MQLLEFLARLGWEHLDERLRQEGAADERAAAAEALMPPRKTGSSALALGDVRSRGRLLADDECHEHMIRISEDTANCTRAIRR